MVPYKVVYIHLLLKFFFQLTLTDRMSSKFTTFKRWHGTTAQANKLNNYFHLSSRNTLPWQQQQWRHKKMAMTQFPVLHIAKWNGVRVRHNNMRNDISSLLTVTCKCLATNIFTPSSSLSLSLPLSCGFWSLLSVQSDIDKTIFNQINGFRTMPIKMADLHKTKITFFSAWWWEIESNEKHV